jgi:hypothetical protein
MGTWTGIGSRIVVATAAVLTLGPAQMRATVIGPIAVRDATAEQLQLTHWAVQRYEAAGLKLPYVELTFHADPSGCGDNSGFFSGSGRLDMCVPGTSPLARNVLVHELAHAWCETHLNASDERRFLAFRDLTAWNSYDVPWGLRGMEQAAEIIDWAVGDRMIPPLLPDGTDHPAQLRAAYRELTDTAAPA